MVRRIPFKRADSDTSALFFPFSDTKFFALAFLRANSAADCGQIVCFAYNLRGGGRVALFEVRDKARNIHLHRTALHTGRVFAVVATTRLRKHFLLVKAQRNLAEILNSFRPAAQINAVAF